MSKSLSRNHLLLLGTLPLVRRAGRCLHDFVRKFSSDYDRERGMVIPR